MNTTKKQKNNRHSRLLLYLEYRILNVRKTKVFREMGLLFKFEFWLQRSLWMLRKIIMLFMEYYNCYTCIIVTSIILYDPLVTSSCLY